MPLPTSEPVVKLVAVPHTPIFVLVTASSVSAHHTCSLAPLDVHVRPKESLEAHGASIDAQVRCVAPHGADADAARLIPASLFIHTANNYTLIYTLTANYLKPAYAVVLASTGASLQDCLPVAQGAAHTSLGAMLRSATKTLLHGASALCNLANLEHFLYQATDDESRNAPVPLARLVLAKIIKVSSLVRCFWAKLNLHNLIYYNHLNQLQVLNYKTLRTESVALERYPCLHHPKVLDYNLQQNHFFCLNGSNDLILFQVSGDPEKKLLKDHRGDSKDLVHSHEPAAAVSSPPVLPETALPPDSDSVVLVKDDFLAHLDYVPHKFVFSPHSDLILFVLMTEESAVIRIHHLCALPPRLRLVRTLTPFPSSKAVVCLWATCGSFFVCLNVDTGLWKVYLKFGSLLFDSDIAHSLLFSGESAESNTHFCWASHVAIDPNSMAIYVISQDHCFFKLDLLHLHMSSYKLSSFPLLYDDSYVTIPYLGLKVVSKVPILPSFQKVVAHMQHSASSMRAGHKASGSEAQFTMQLNSFDQLSMSYGANLCVSTPVCLGSVANHVLWYLFYNHSMSTMNIVHHFWLDDFLVLINRFEEETAMDEMVMLNTSNSKFGNIGKQFKFDSDLILWRHTFKNQILSCHVSASKNQGQTLVVLCDDFRLIVMEIDPKSLLNGESGTEKRRLLRGSKTIHLSSIKNKLSFNRIKDMVNIYEEHFFFLLETGDVYLLKNQANSSDPGPQTKNMYELVLIGHGVERVEVGEIEFGPNKARPVLSLYFGESMHVYNLAELLEVTDTGAEAPLAVAGVDHVPRNMAGCRPVSIQAAGFFPLRLVYHNIQGERTLEVMGLEYQVSTRSKHLLVRPRVGRLLVLKDFVYHDLMRGHPLQEIHANYLAFKSYSYCLELLLVNTVDEPEQMSKVTGLIQESPNMNQIYVSFLRKIEASHWSLFFSMLNMKPLEYMNELLSSQDVDLCYSFLNIYLNHKREHGDEDQELLGQDEQAVVLRILRMLKMSKRWDQFLELCRYIKFLQPEGQIFEEIQILANDRGTYK